MASGSISVPVTPRGRNLRQSWMVWLWKRMPWFASRTEPSQIMAFRPLMPPNVFSTLTSPIFLLAWLLTCFTNSRLAGMTSLRVVFRSGSADEEYGRTCCMAAAMEGRLLEICDEVSRDEN